MWPCLTLSFPRGSQYFFCILGYFTLSLSLFSLSCSRFLSHPCCKMLFKALKGWTVIFKKLNEYACWLLFLPEREWCIINDKYCVFCGEPCVFDWIWSRGTACPQSTEISNSNGADPWMDIKHFFCRTHCSSVRNRLYNVLRSLTQKVKLYLLWMLKNSWKPPSIYSKMEMI